MKHKTRNYLATLLGIATSVCTAWAVVDFDALDFHNVKTYFKLIVIGLPAVGGYLSVIKDKDDNKQV